MRVTQHAKAKVTIEFNKNELYMLYLATGGAVFKSTKSRNVPVLASWTKDKAEVFENYIRDNYKNLSGNKTELSFTSKELSYATRILKDHMEELDPIEYPTITGNSWEEAQALLRQLKELD